VLSLLTYNVPEAVGAYNYW